MSLHAVAAIVSAIAAGCAMLSYIGLWAFAWHAACLYARGEREDRGEATAWPATIVGPAFTGDTDYIARYMRRLGQEEFNRPAAKVQRVANRFAQVGHAAAALALAALLVHYVAA